MITLDEHILTFSQVSPILPRRRAGKPAHISCIYRWTTSGCRGVILESIQIGATRCTSREALDRFFATLAGQQTKPPAVPLGNEGIAFGWEQTVVHAADLDPARQAAFKAESGLDLASDGVLRAEAEFARRSK